MNETNHLDDCKTKEIKMYLGLRPCMVKDKKTGKRISALQKAFTPALFCEDHKVECCRCGYEFGRHQFSDLENRVAKDYCVSCGIEINKHNYKMNGNFCPGCCAMAGAKAKVDSGNAIFSILKEMV